MSKTVALDVDGTLAVYDGWKGEGVVGPAFPGAREFTRELAALGFRIVIHSVRANTLTGLKFLQQWLVAEDLTYDEVWVAPGKPIAVAYVDDRTPGFPVVAGTPDYEALLEYIHGLA